jgi:hypothetical protein
MKPSDITKVMIAPCGMNCAICIGHLREKNTCPGCRLMNKTNRKYVKKCRAKLCEKRSGKYCFSCTAEFPCSLIAGLDKRYRKKYGMSEIENLAFIKKYGIKAFVRKEQKRWKCQECGNLLSCHRDECPSCGGPKT